METSRITHPPLTAAEDAYGAIKEALNHLLTQIPPADDAPDVYDEWARSLKSCYSEYLQFWSQLMRSYRLAAATESLRNLAEEKNNIKIEVNESIHLTNNILSHSCKDFDSISDVASVLSLKNSHPSVSNKQNIDHANVECSHNVSIATNMISGTNHIKNVIPPTNVMLSHTPVCTDVEHPVSSLSLSHNQYFASHANPVSTVPLENVLHPQNVSTVGRDSGLSNVPQFTPASMPFSQPPVSLVNVASQASQFTPHVSSFTPTSHANLVTFTSIPNSTANPHVSQAFSSAQIPMVSHSSHAYRRPLHVNNSNARTYPYSHDVPNPNVNRTYPYSSYVPNPNVNRTYPYSSYVPNPNVNRTYPYSPYVPNPNVNHAFQHQTMDPASIFLIKQELFKKPINPFKGDPSEFLMWYSTIQNKLRGVPLNSFDTLSILEAHTEGEPQKIIRETMAVGAANPDQTLADCWQRLWDQYGAGGQVTESLLAKLEKIPPIKYVNQTDKLNELLATCKMILCNMQTSPDLMFFNTSFGIKRIFFKLPERLQDSWRDYEVTYGSNHNGAGAPFADFVNFLSAKLKKYSLPSYKTSPWISNPEKQNKLPPSHSFKKPANASTFQTDKVRNAQPEKSPEKQDRAIQEIACILHPNGKHDIKDCRSFSSKTFDEKRSLCFKAGLCYLCLGQHRQADCDGTQKCTQCNGKHLSVMHNEKFNHKNVNSSHRKGNPSDSNNRDQDKSSLCTKICGLEGNFRSCSKTVLVTLTNRNKPGKILKCYCIIDEQSSSCFATSAVANFFGINSPTVDYHLNTLSGYQSKFTGIELNDFFIKGVGEKKGFYLPKMVTNDSIVNNRDEIASPKIVAAHSHISHLAKHFNEVDGSANIMLLLGRDCGAAMRTKCHGHKAPYAHHTSLGWALVGQTCIPDTTPSVMNVMKVNLHEALEIQPCFSQPALKPLNSQNIFEECASDEHKSLSQNEQQFINIVNDNISIGKDGHIIMPLPFKSNDIFMPDNRAAVFHRTNNTLQRMKGDESKLQQSLETMNKYISAGHVEQLSDDEQLPPTGKYWYIPVFPVTHPKKEKVRIVFDSSAKYKGTSLNEELLTGPDVLNNLRSVLLHFREAQIGFTADVESLFHNFVLPTDDRNYVRFFWFAKNNPDSKLVSFRATRHIFGNSSSPALATLGLRFAIMNADPPSSDLAADLVFNKCYVDDCIASCHTPEEAIKTIQDSRDSLTQFNIRLHKIQSNSPVVLEAFPVTERTPPTDPDKPDCLSSALGVPWDPESDTLFLKFDVPEHPFTKRGILATINSFLTQTDLVVL